jgi:predicted O-methyltransferase YrrM
MALKSCRAVKGPHLFCHWRKIVTSLKEPARKLYFRPKLFRHMARWLIRDKRSPIDFSHILSFREEQIGPVYRDEALFLFALTRVLRPQTIVEFGFKTGHSALNFLAAADPDCHVFSYDIAVESEENCAAMPWSCEEVSVHEEVAGGLFANRY